MLIRGSLIQSLRRMNEELSHSLTMSTRSRGGRLLLLFLTLRSQLKPFTNLSCSLSICDEKTGEGNHPLRGSYVNTRFSDELLAQSVFAACYFSHVRDDSYEFPGLLETLMLRAYAQPFKTNARASVITTSSQAVGALTQQQKDVIGGDSTEALSVFAQEALHRKSRYLIRQKQEIEKQEIERALHQQMQAQKELDRLRPAYCFSLTCRAIALQAKQTNAEMKLLKQQREQQAQQEAAAAKQQQQQAQQAQQAQQEHALHYSHLYPQFPLTAYPHPSSYTTAMNQSYPQYSHMHMQVGCHS